MQPNIFRQNFFLTHLWPMLPFHHFAKGFPSVFRGYEMETLNCVKSVRIRSSCGPYFPAFGLKTGRYGYFSVLSPNAGKCGAE